MKDLDALFAILATPRNIIITTHVNPDADALGSSLGLFHFLLGRGHRVHVITPNDYPEFLKWMDGNDQVIAFDKSKERLIRGLIEESEVIFCLDFSDLRRIRDIGRMVKASTAQVVLIDHHLDPEPFADYELWDTRSAATAELIYDFILMCDGKEEITSAIANCLYAGIMTDTGSFKHPSTTSKIHRTVADLIDLGANVNQVSRNIYDNNSISRIRFLGYALMEKLVILQEHHAAYFVITSDEHERFGLKSGDTEGLVNYALSIRDIYIAAIVIERENEIKLSFRSLGNYAVNTFAATHFQGGGHKNAAGGVSALSLGDTIKKLEELFKKPKEFKPIIDLK